MLLPELSRKNKNGMAPSVSFWRGIYRRLADRNREKIFVVGFHKTGTTSLAKALLILGYRVCGHLKDIDSFDPAVHGKEELYQMIHPLLDHYDAFEDTPWFLFYKELLEEYPDAKFILTVRPSESWYRSVVKHFGGYDKWNFHSWIYQGHGDPVGNRELYIRTYEEHNRQVRDYFRYQNKELLEMDLTRNFDWETLCSFLQKKKPVGSFPHANTGISRNKFRRKVLDKAKDLYYG